MSGRDTSATPILIVGGGHAGLLLALALDRAGLPVTVIDGEPVEAALDAPFGGRALALMYGSKRVFDALGVWPEFEAVAEPVSGVRVLDQATGEGVHYDAADVGPHPFAYGIENRMLRRRLLEVALRRAGIVLHAPARLAGIERHTDRIVARVGDGRRFEAALLVGADGRGSSVRAFAGIATERWPYHQSAITFAVRHSRPHGGLVRELLRPAGPLALLPIGPELSAVTWVEVTAVAGQLLAAGRGALLAALTERVGDVLGELELVGEPCAYPLSAHRARRFVAPRIALIGDAAHGVHPIHAQGFNLGVRDVAALTEVLADAARTGLDLGSAENLVRYDRWRRGDARFVVGLTDGLNRLFSTDLAPARLIRGLGLGALERIAPLKQLAMRRGMGLFGDLPKLARGEAL